MAMMPLPKLQLENIFCVTKNSRRNMKSYVMQFVGSVLTALHRDNELPPAKNGHWAMRRSKKTKVLDWIFVDDATEEEIEADKLRNEHVLSRQLKEFSTEVSKHVLKCLEIGTKLATIFVRDRINKNEENSQEDLKRFGQALRQKLSNWDGRFVDFLAEIRAKKDNSDSLEKFRNRFQDKNYFTDIPANLVNKCVKQLKRYGLNRAAEFRDGQLKPSKSHYTTKKGYPAHTYQGNRAEILSSCSNQISKLAIEWTIAMSRVHPEVITQCVTKSADHFNALRCVPAMLSSVGFMPEVRQDVATKGVDIPCGEGHGGSRLGDIPQKSHIIRKAVENMLPHFQDRHLEHGMGVLNYSLGKAQSGFSSWLSSKTTTPNVCFDRQEKGICWVFSNCVETESKVIAEGL